MQENDYILLLGKQLGDELSPEEALRLDEWLRQSPDYQRLASDIRRAWEQTGNFPSQAPPADPEAGFARIQAKIRAAEPRPAAKVFFLNSRVLLRVAAALTLLLAALWAFRAFGPAAAGGIRVELAQNEAKRVVQLPDGSQVWLRQGARLEFPTRFAADERRVRLDGEAYFEVTHQPAQPFRIQTGSGELVEVLGTQFGVSAPGKGRTSVLVRSGKVRFSPDGRQKGTLLTAGKKGVYDRHLAKISITEPTSFNELAWQSGGLEFIHTPLHQVIADLKAWYGVDIELRNPGLSECPYTAPLTDQPLEQVLTGLAVAYQLKWSRLQTGEYVLSGGVCR